MKQVRLVTLLFPLTLACTTVPPAQSTSLPPSLTPAEQRINALADEFVEAFFREFPVWATLEGYPTADHARLNDNSLAALRAWEQREDTWLAAARSIDANGLQGRASYRTLSALKELLEASVGTRICRSELWNVSPTFTGWHSVVSLLASVQPVGSPQARADAVARFRQLPLYLDTEISNLREGVQRGYVAPRTGVQSVIEQMDALLATPVADSPFLSPAQRDTAAPVSFRTDLSRVVGQEINPAIRRYNDYLRREYLPAARASIAVSETPGGPACYRASIRANTGLDIDPAQIHQTGLREITKIRAEMQAIAQSHFGVTDVSALLQRVRTDPQFTFRSREEMVAYARAAVERARRAAPNWFGIIPRASVVVQPYPPFQERAAPGGQYNAPSEDGTRPGLYLINTYQPEKQSRAGLESTAFHETYPGHHMQIAIARERPDAHSVLRYFGSSGFIEGWGLYSERLADEMGLFSGPVDRLGLLSNEALRAARLVVDAGMHALGWPRQQAIDYLLANTTEPAEHAASEIDRYIAVPGQATAYMLGNLEIRRLRADAERAFGSQFSIKDFHDRVLEDGNVTLPLLREKIERWIATAR
jgi:uncharacterized protein (DUF885 family)